MPDAVTQRVGKAQSSSCMHVLLMTLLVMAGALFWRPVGAAERSCTVNQWPLWETWASRYVQNDGRMLESSMAENHSTSEGQSYGMLFALIANDQVRFDKLWKWTAANMMGSDLDARLPGWLWGKGKDGKWQLQDANSASDADLWIVYALLEAARVWQKPAYRNDALRLLKTVEEKLVVNLPGLGKMLLPGPEGFVQPNNLWRLNPSYLPVPLLRRLAKEVPQGPWQQVADNTVKMIRTTSPKGFTADWIAYRGTSSQSGVFVADPIKGEAGSYDAIRVYLWAGMTPRNDPSFHRVLKALDGMAKSTPPNGVPPETVQIYSGKTDGVSPFGFSAALVPYFMARDQNLQAEQQKRIAESSMAAAFAKGEQLTEPLYYNVMLSLFALGWVEKRYQFRTDGTLKLSWETSCVRAVLR
ncbi:MAG: cellulose synthase complex periplasmic endoglucanase BcsZ [Oxalicibacterium faecigallinarum]|uniref:cellulose synthase complex periplasmic endoglucanase BcsZ n=1 Tax=Oxalicibacterium faecigallinarum TaxID=573741 RepID=UPI002806E4DD|nr:cellulose synthase complex periplasmic endoglucanase BcsZ [Oxalicibacterium faecigallinarum]MDQ7969912.1 cellulose synthase complex periplasmic endoglucanase BcsZ [Oxalicibacterium faecigallinarum]